MPVSIQRAFTRPKRPERGKVGVYGSQPQDSAKAARTTPEPLLEGAGLGVPPGKDPVGSRGQQCLCVQRSLMVGGPGHMRAAPPMSEGSEDSNSGLDFRP